MEFHQKAYVCIHVFEHERPVLLVSREDGDWCLLCGDFHEQSPDEYRVVGIGHFIERDASLQDVLDLHPNWEAERESVNSPWHRRPVPAQEDAEN